MSSSQDVRSSQAGDDPYRFEPPVVPLVVAASIELYDRFYDALGAYIESSVGRLGRLIVLDLHSYNHRRGGPDSEPAPAVTSPDYNLGTATVVDRAAWNDVIDESLAVLSAAGACGTAASVGENVKFGGGHMARWLHARFGSRVCVLSLEVKKFFMDEWTGRPRRECVEQVGRTVASLGERLLELL